MEVSIKNQCIDESSIVGLSFKSPSDNNSFSDGLSFKSPSDNNSFPDEGWTLARKETLALFGGITLTA